MVGNNKLVNPISAAPLLTGVHPGWLRALLPVRDELEQIAVRLAQHPEPYLPAPELVMRAFWSDPDGVRVVIIGQDPYPAADHACGLAFSVPPSLTKIPASLRNIYQELHDDLGIPPASHGDLSQWSEQGVMLLNRFLTTGAGDSLSHKDLGWSKITDAALRYLNQLAQPPVVVLWGRWAGQLANLVPDAPKIVSAHPSPLSARRGFFGSRPFSKINQILAQRGSPGIDWQLSDQAQLW